MAQNAQHWLPQTKADEARLLRVLTRLVEYCLRQEENSVGLGVSEETEKSKEAKSEDAVLIERVGAESPLLEADASENPAPQELAPHTRSHKVHTRRRRAA